MSLNINNESTIARRTEKKRYGNLFIETTLRDDKGGIDLTMPINRIQNNAGQSPDISLISQEISESSSSIKRIKDISKKKSINSNNTTKITRGQKVSINSKTKNLSKLLIALDWEIKYRGNTELQLDTSLFLVDESNKTTEENFIFYGNPRSYNESIIIDKDFNSGVKNAYDQVIELNLNSIPENIEKLAVTVTIYEGDKRNQNFGQISEANFRILDIENRNEIYYYNFNEGLNKETAIVVAEIYRYKNEWKVNPIGNGFLGGLKALCNNYGVETD